MSEQTEKLLFEVELSKSKLLADLGQIRTRSAEVRADTKAATAELNKLAEAGLKGTAEFKKLESQIAANERELRGLSRQAQEVNKSLDAAESSIGSYNRMAAEGAVLEKQLKQVAVGVDISVEAYEQLRQKVEANKLAQRDFARSSGDMRALVGAYKEELAPAIRDVGEDIRELQAQLAALAEQRSGLDGTTKEAQTLDQQMAALQAQILETEKGLSGTAAEAGKAAVSLAQMRQRLAELQAAREGASSPEDFERLNGEILGLSTNIQQAEGKIDEFGERVQRNLKRENVDTLNDAAGGLVGTLNILNVVTADSTNLQAVQASALKAIAIAQNLRNVQIGVASAREAALIVLQKIKLVQTEAEIAAVGRLTVAQRLYNLVASANPIGLIIVALVALAGIIFQLRDSIGNFISQFESLKNVSESVSGALRSVGEQLGFIETAEAKATAARVKRYTEGLALLAEQKKQELELRTVQGANAAELFKLKRDELTARQATADAAVRETKAKIKAEGETTAELKKELEERLADARQLANDEKVLQAEARARQTAGLNDYLNNLVARYGKGGQIIKSQADSEIAALRARGADELTIFRAQSANEQQLREQQRAGIQDRIANLERATKLESLYGKAGVEQVRRDLAERLLEARLFDEESDRLRVESARREVELARQQQQQLLAVRVGFIDLALAKEKEAGGIESAETLRLTIERIRLQRDAELLGANLTKQQRQLIRAKANAEELAAERRHQQTVRQQSLAAGLAYLDAAIAQEQQGSDRMLELLQNRLLQEKAAKLAAIAAEGGDRAQEAKVQAEADKAQADIEFNDSLRRLEQYLADKRQAVERANAAGTLTEEQYQQQIAAVEQVAYAARKAVFEDYRRDTVDLDRQAADAQIAEQKRVTDKNAEAARKRLAIAQQVGEQAGQILADSFQAEGKELETFLSGLLVLVLDTIQKQLIAQQAATIASATAQSLVQADSVATFGASGLARAALLTALITGAFEVAKAGIRAGLSSGSNSSGGTGFATGGLIDFGPGGPTDDRVPVRVSRGESIINAKSTSMFGPLLSWMNEQGGGVSFYRDSTPPATWARYAEGGVVRYDPATFAGSYSINNTGGQLIDPAAIAGYLGPVLLDAVVHAVAAIPVRPIPLTEIATGLKRLTDKQEAADL